jgi:hypothetical protein
VDSLTQYLIENTGSNAAVQVSGPALILFTGRKLCSDSFPVSLKLQLQTDGVIRPAAETTAVIVIGIQ